MAYCSQTDIEYDISQDTLIDLTDDSGADTVDSDVVDWAIQKADRFIDSYLKKQTTTPLTTVPDEIQNVSVDLSVYHLYKRRRDVSSDDLDAGITERFTNSLEWLRDVANGVVEIGLDTNITTGGRFRASKTSSDRVYTDSKLEMY